MTSEFENQQGQDESVWEVMRTARAIRHFQDAPVNDTVLLRCLEAATWAPSGGNQQPWRFIVLRSAEARSALGVAAQSALAVIERVYHLERPAPTDESPAARNARAMFSLHDDAEHLPAAVLFALRPQPAVPPLFQGGSIYPAMENFLLAARASGLGAVVTGWHVTGEQSLREGLGVPPEWELASLVVVGWPKGQHGPVRRKPVRDVVAFDSWDGLPSQGTRDLNDRT
jgi:nitroreductase